MTVELGSSGRFSLFGAEGKDSFGGLCIVVLLLNIPSFTLGFQEVLVGGSRLMVILC